MISSKSILIIILSLLTISCSDNRSMIEKIESFRAAREAGNYEAAEFFLAADAHVWFEKREGEGTPLQMGYGPYKNWDEHFNSKGTVGEWTVEDNTVWAVANEWNEYYALIERQDTGQYRVTYYFNSDGAIEGYMISAAYPDKPSKPSLDRFEEIEAWANENHQQEWEYLRPGGKLDPTGDRAPRTRKLINLWREEVGLSEIE